MPDTRGRDGACAGSNFCGGPLRAVEQGDRAGTGTAPGGRMRPGYPEPRVDPGGRVSSHKPSVEQRIFTARLAIAGARSMPGPGEAGLHEMDGEHARGDAVATLHWAAIGQVASARAIVGQRRRQSQQDIVSLYGSWAIRCGLMARRGPVDPPAASRPT